MVLESNVINVLIKLQSSGVSQSTLTHVSYKLKFLAKHVNLKDSEAVNRFIANMKTDNTTRTLLLMQEKIHKLNTLSFTTKLRICMTEGKSNWFARQVEKEAKNDVMNISERRGEVVAAIGVLIVLLFWLAHQIWSTGFFTSKFGSTEAFVLYAPILLGVFRGILRSVVGRKQTLRLFEVGWFIFVIVSFVWLWVVFPFAFSHLADVLPSFLQFLLTWISDDIAKAFMVLAILGTAFFTVYNALLYVYVRRELSKPTLKSA